MNRNKLNSKYLLLLGITSILFVLLLSACESKSSDKVISSNEIEKQNMTKLPNDISGLIALNVDVLISSNLTGGIFRLKLDNGQIEESRTITNSSSGIHPYLHKSGKIIFTEPCGLAVNRIKMFKSNGLVTNALTSCTDKIKHENIYSSEISFGKLSPDESKIATEMYYGNAHYISAPDNMIVIYDTKTGEELKRYVNFANPEWHPDGRLLLSPFGSGTKDTGIYISNKNFTSLSRIDKNQINMDIYMPDISPSGEQVIFTMGQQIWMMDMDGENLHEVIVGNANLQYPTWSPDEKYIAYLRIHNISSDKQIMFYNIDTKKRIGLNTSNILPINSYPAGPLSWIK
jgi:hypothetical protein